LKNKNKFALKYSIRKNITTLHHKEKGKQTKTIDKEAKRNAKEDQYGKK